MRIVTESHPVSRDELIALARQRFGIDDPDTRAEVAALVARLVGR